MALIIFLIVLSVLIFVHELGHFAVAKFFGIRVDEFGLGFPPKAKSLFTWRGTEFTLNWLPLGGFVRIFGENAPTEVGVPTGVGRGESFQEKNRGIQAAVLSAGVVMNFLFAWLLISIGFASGMPSSATSSFPIENAQTTITSVLPNSPADLVGLKPGDIILSASRGGAQAGEMASDIANFIAESEAPLEFQILRGKQIESIQISPTYNDGLGRPVIGVSMDEVGVAKLSLSQAVVQGLKTLLDLTRYTAEALWNLIAQALRGQGSLSGLTGPVGLVGIVGDASTLGFSYLLSLTALLSINLTLINLLPFPALDGGRLLAVFVEAVCRRSIPARVLNLVNTIGFALLIFLMVAITIQDIRNIF